MPTHGYPDHCLEQLRPGKATALVGQACQVPTDGPTRSFSDRPVYSHVQYSNLRQETVSERAFTGLVNEARGSPVPLHVGTHAGPWQSCSPRREQ